MSFVFNFETDFKLEDINEIFKKFNTEKDSELEEEDGLDEKEFAQMILSFAKEGKEQ